MGQLRGTEGEFANWWSGRLSTDMAYERPHWLDINVKLNDYILYSWMTECKWVARAL